MKTPIRYLTSNLTKENALEIKTQLMICFNQDKIYLDRSLSLRTLAEHLGTNTKYLSQVINQTADKNFQSFIHEYRIEEFQKRLLNGEAQQYTFYGVAYDCGFANRSTFYRAFKIITGQTPKEYYHGNRAA